MTGKKDLPTCVDCREEKFGLLLYKTVVRAQLSSLPLVRVQGECSLDLSASQEAWPAIISASPPTFNSDL